MTIDDALYRFRLRALALATELGNVRAACKAMGIHPSTFYPWRHQVLRFDPEILASGAATTEDGQPDLAVPGAAGGGLRPGPPGVRPGQDLRGAPKGQVGRDRALPQRGAPGPPPAWVEHPGQAPGPRGWVRCSTRAGATPIPAGAAPGRSPTWRDGPDGLLLHRQALRGQGSGVAVHGDRRGLGVLLGGAAPDPAQPNCPVDLRVGPSSRAGTWPLEGGRWRRS